MSKKFIFALAISIFCLARAQNQDDNPSYPKALNIGMGLFALKCDLSDSYKTFTPGYVASIKFNKKKRFNGGLAVNFFHVIAENDDKNWDENLTNVPENFVKTRVFSGEYSLNLNIVKKPKHNLYFGQGIGFAYFQPLDVKGNRLADRSNTRNRNETFSNTTLILPTTIAYQWMPNEEFGIFIQMKWLRQRTDYFDNLSELSLNKINDNVFTIQFGVSFLLSANKKSENSEAPNPNYQHRRYRNKK
ncbi:MAG: hypothetical protein SNJ77_10580 [Cytophagales bacterium]